MTLATSAREASVTTELRTYESAQHGFPFSAGYPIDADLAGRIGALGRALDKAGGRPHDLVS
ncbi:hypothetical protein BS329_01875 [Amycolatopsis coloradensis]|uniref:Dienelactone hydrolase domain-containing protein n=1 Tax=Amycolatopsis coloradensis TaxID=76021 RepID=A0A1R0L1Y9_9PSEU|nr:hypothetical protein BS329_01875 [Amycolatopsis coloradensis]